MRTDWGVFLSAGGYHHHLALNTYYSEGADPAPRDAAGLHHFAIRYPTREAFVAAVRTLVEAGVRLAGGRPRLCPRRVLPRPGRQRRRAVLGPAARGVGARSGAARRRRSAGLDVRDHRQAHVRRGRTAADERQPVGPRRRRIPGVLGSPGVGEEDGEVARGDVQPQAMPGLDPVAGMAEVDLGERARCRRVHDCPNSSACARPSGCTSTSLTCRNSDGASLVTSRCATTRPARVTGSSQPRVVKVRTSGRDSTARSSGTEQRRERVHEGRRHEVGGVVHPGDLTALGRVRREQAAGLIRRGALGAGQIEAELGRARRRPDRRTPASPRGGGASARAAAPPDPPAPPERVEEVERRADVALEHRLERVVVDGVIAGLRIERARSGQFSWSVEPACRYWKGAVAGFRMSVS